MSQPESIEAKAFQFNNNIADQTQFRVASIFEGKCTLSSYNRRDFFKISLITKGASELLYADRGIKINKPAIVFTNPLVPYSWEATDGAEIEEGSGFFCVFTEEFLHQGNRMESLQESTLFKAGGDAVFFLNNTQVEYIYGIFNRMRQEFDGEYIYKYELMRNQVNLIIHEVIKMQPAVAYLTPQNAASRIAKLFLSLLEKQFPVDSPRFALKLKKAGDYASKLAVHVNHLNAAVQEVTGKSTTMHINEKILLEAKSLLTHTDWSVAKIAFSLGFEYPSYFNNFFKKHTGTTPLALRKYL